MMTQEEKRIKSIEILQEYMPAGTALIAYEWIQRYRFRFRISKTRQSRFGDYQPPLKSGQIHRISVNHDLNPYAFLITFTHEVAHLITYEKYQERVNPHGEEWKNEFVNLLAFFLDKNIFPEDLKRAVLQYIQNPRASSCSDQDLYRALKKYDKNPVVHLEEIPIDSVFKLGKKGIYKKGAKRRTRYLCQHVETKKMYLISGIAEVSVVAAAMNLV
jgi:hypothetical protein